MRKRTSHTPMNLLMSLASYERLRRVSRETNTTMSKIIREGIDARLDQIEKVNNSIAGGKDNERTDNK
jgi:predicted DNA-binding protein